MIEEQREKEFLFELEQLCHNYHIIMGGPDDFQLMDARGRRKTPDVIIDRFINYLRAER